MNAPLTIHSTLNDIVQEDVQRTAVLERLGLDACCGGQQTLAQACDALGLDPKATLQKVLAGPAADEPSPSLLDGMGGTLTEAVGHLIEKHHTYLKEALPRLGSLLDKVVKAHLTRHPELNTIKYLFVELRADLEPHMTKEEQILFPMIRQMESSDDTAATLWSSLQNPIRVMEAEHQRAETLLNKIRKTTLNYMVPEDGCGSYKLLMEGLRELEADTRLHIQKENEILFPLALALAETMK